MKMKLLTFSILLILTFTGCRTSKSSAEYVVRNQIVKHNPNEVSAFKFQVMLRNWSRHNKSYLEVGQYEYNQHNAVLLCSEGFRDFNRYNIVTGPYRQQTNGLTDHINFAELDSTACKNYQQKMGAWKANGFDTIVSQINRGNRSFDYSFSEDCFLNLKFKLLSLDKQTKAFKRVKLQNNAYLWIKGRKHPIQLNEFDEVLKNFLTDLSRNRLFTITG